MSAQAEPAIMYTPRLCDNETIANKLIYRIRQHQLSPAELDGLQARCRSELRQLQQELDVLLNELRSVLKEEHDISMPRHERYERIA
ncbi:hypothetical protein B1748_30905 [Paenibacillus sp. MY03]|jgi:hypothetical protein|uniref:hypothetical protein n=1 Tax=Paenibacillus sp. MY03 TaxID=302980 RepID=UPI000B3CCDD3|nr:hypothetical protein [Paenibacillus sp. MY03]OUS69577.1 hypothetical protein B1748_30905 [Paenibacillus sp. MY03]